MITEKQREQWEENIFYKSNKNDLAIAVLIAAEKISSSLESVAIQLKYLGNGDASTTHGAIEGLGMANKETLESLGNSIEGGLRSIAEAISEKE